MARKSAGLIPISKRAGLLMAKRPLVRCRVHALGHTPLPGAARPYVRGARAWPWVGHRLVKTGGGQSRVRLVRGCDTTPVLPALARASLPAIRLCTFFGGGSKPLLRQVSYPAQDPLSP